LPLGLEVFCKFHVEASTELHSGMQNSHFHHASKNKIIVIPENLKTDLVSISFPADGVTLKFLVEGGLGCFHCIEAHFDSGW
jgi:hypothetical protein